MTLSDRPIGHVAGTTFSPVLTSLTIWARRLLEVVTHFSAGLLYGMTGANKNTVKAALAVTPPATRLILGPAAR